MKQYFATQDNLKTRHSREGGEVATGEGQNPGNFPKNRILAKAWIPAFAGMTGFEIVLMC